MDLHKYQCERSDGTTAGPTFDTYDKAKEHARANGLRVIEYTFTFSSSELVDDYTDED